MSLGLILGLPTPVLRLWYVLSMSEMCVLRGCWVDSGYGRMSEFCRDGSLRRDDVVFSSNDERTSFYTVT